MALYRGLGYPFKRSKTAYPAAVEDNDLIKQSLFQIIRTGQGQRIMRPGFGTNLHQYVFENNGPVLAEMIRADLSISISRYEPRVILRNIEVTENDNELLLTVQYVVVATRMPDSVTIPISKT